MSDVILEPPPPPDPTDDAEVHVDLTSAVTETGDATFGRTTTVNENITGNSVNESTRLQVFKE